MADAQSKDMIRSSDRHALTLPIRLRAAETQPGAVQFADGRSDAEGWIEVQLVNISTGGLGIESPVFLPRGGEFRIRGNFGHNAVHSASPVHHIGHSDADAAGDPDRTERTHFDIHACARRVAMTNQKPLYEIGLSFVDLSAVMRDRVQAFLDLIEQDIAPADAIAGGTR